MNRMTPGLGGYTCVIAYITLKHFLFVIGDTAASIPNSPGHLTQQQTQKADQQTHSERSRRAEAESPTHPTQPQVPPSLPDPALLVERYACLLHPIAECIQKKNCSRLDILWFDQTFGEIQQKILLEEKEKKKESLASCQRASCTRQQPGWCSALVQQHSSDSAR